MGEVVALVQQGLAGGLGEGVGEAVAEVQPRSVAAALAEVAVGLAGDLGLLPRDGLDPQVGCVDEFVEAAAGDNAAQLADV